MKNLSAMNDVYSRQFTSPYPARTTIGVAALPMGALIEMQRIARRWLQYQDCLTRNMQIETKSDHFIYEVLFVIPIICNNYIA